MPRFRPRISLLNALLLTTIAGMAIVIVQFWREIGPLREELTRRRAEMGQLFITDQAKPHAIGVDWDQDGTWRWRLYLPDTQNYAIRTYFGRHKQFDGENLRAWLSGPRAEQGRIRSSIGGVGSGEHTLELKLAKDGDGWFLQEGKGAKHQLPEQFNSWLENPKLRYTVSKVLNSRQLVFERNEPIVLLCLQHANETRTDGIDGDTIVVWIEEGL